MFLIRRPSEAFIQQTIETQSQRPVTYPGTCLGWTKESRCPVGFAKNQWQYIIGQGEEDYHSAKQALNEWRMLNFDWFQLVRHPEFPSQGGTLCTLVRTMGIYSLNVARIVYVEDDSQGHRFSIGYGTLPEYPLSGEERLTVCLDPDTQNVIYEIFSFSRPASWLVQLGSPYVRRVQKKFCTDSSIAMKTVTQGGE